MAIGPQRRGRVRGAAPQRVRVATGGARANTRRPRWPGCRPQRLSPGLLQAAHRSGKQVHVWTVDDAETMNRLIDVGVDGIFTDRIDTLKDVLQQRGLWAGTS